MIPQIFQINQVKQHLQDPSFLLTFQIIHEGLHEHLSPAKGSGSSFRCILY